MADGKTYLDGSPVKEPLWRKRCTCGTGFGELCDKKGLNVEECIAPWRPYSEEDGPSPNRPLDPAPPEGISAGEAEVITTMVMNLMSDAETLPKDMVTLPEHYARFEIEPIRFICENNLNFFQGNIVKYIMRWDAKNGLEDLRKAKRYLEMFIKWVEKDPDWWR